jgi:hypothetical protein
MRCELAPESAAAWAHTRCAAAIDRVIALRNKKPPRPCANCENSVRGLDSGENSAEHHINYRVRLNQFLSVLQKAARIPQDRTGNFEAISKAASFPQ